SGVGTRSASPTIFSGTTSRGSSPAPSQMGQTPPDESTPNARQRVQRRFARDTGSMVRSFGRRGGPTRPGRVSARGGPHLPVSPDVVVAGTHARFGAGVNSNHARSEPTSSERGSCARSARSSPRTLDVALQLGRLDPRQAADVHSTDIPAFEQGVNH